MVAGEFRPRAVLFDCDGVIVDSERITNQAMRDDFAGYGLDLSLDQTMSLFVGGTMSGVYKQACAMGADLPETWVEDFYLKMYAALADSVEAVDGILPVLDALDAAGIPYGVGSNGRIAKMDVTLGRIGIKDRFQGRLYSAQDLPNPKPAPDVYLKIASDLGVAPVDCAVIEDSASGARAGQAAGMRTFGFAAETPADVLAPHCDVVFDDMAQLPSLLGL